MKKITKLRQKQTLKTSTELRSVQLGNKTTKKKQAAAVTKLPKIIRKNFKINLLYKSDSKIAL